MVLSSMTDQSATRFPDQRTHDPLAFARWHLGEIRWRDALRSGAIEVTGRRDLARALPTWNRNADPLPLAGRLAG